MKISNASKKVLASALSAAMVVAFAPTVAFGAVAGNTVTVEFDVNGGSIPATAAAGTQGIQASKTYTVAKKGGDAAKGEITLDQTAIDQYVDADGYAFSGWWYDADNDGKIKADNTETFAKDGAVEVTNVTAGSTIKLVAQYAVPAVTADVAHSVISKTEASNAIKFSVSAASALTDAAYTLEVAGPDGSIYTKAIQGSELAGITDVNLKFNSAASKAAYDATTAASPVVTAAAAVKAGKYTATLKAGDKVVSSSEAEVTEVSLSAVGNSANNGTFQNGDKYANTQKVLALVGATYTSVFAQVKTDSVDVVPGKTDKNQSVSDNEAKDNDDKAFAGYAKGGKTLASYSTGSFTVVDAGSTTEPVVAAGDKLEAVYDYARVEGLAFTNNTLTLTAAGLDTSKYEYAATVNGNEMAASGSTFTFTTGTAKLPVGEYTATLTATKKSDKSTSTVGTAKVTVVKVNYDLGEGKVKDAGKDKFASYYTTADAKIVALPVVSAGADYTAPEGKVLDGWMLDGKKADAAKTVAGTGTDFVVTISANWVESNKAAAPTYTYSNGTLTFAQANGADYAIKYGTASANGAYNGGAVTVAKDGTSVIYAATVVADNVKNPKLDVTGAETVVFGYAKTGIGAAYTSNSALKIVEDFADSALGVKTAASSATKPQYYSDVLTTVKKAGSDAVKATGYASEKDWDKAVLAQEKTVVEAVAANATETLTGMKTAVKSADGKTYTYVSDADFAVAKANIDAVVSAFDKNNDADANNNVAKVNDVTLSDAASYAQAITKAVNGAHKTTVAAADADAAKAVTDQLKAAKTAAELEAALNAYAALTDAQKNLVASADVAAAQNALSAAQLAEAQDEAAIAAVKGKTVKAKAKKASKSSLKVVTSKSGAKSTFKKTSGNSKVKVYKSGKIVVKKGLKAGKKYTVKVKATVGTQTKTVKVIVKVAK